MSAKIAEYTYELPQQLIATNPVEPRDYCRLMLVNRTTQKIEEKYFYELTDLLTGNDVLVLNQSKVFPARLMGRKSTGGRVELLLFHQSSDTVWQSICKPGLKQGALLEFSHGLKGEVITSDPLTGQIEVEFNFGSKDFFAIIDMIGLTPIPPYIPASQSENLLRDQYQTVFAKEVGSSAAPTAGLHFTKELLRKLKSKGVQVEYITLHVGLGTFKPLTQQNLDSGKLHTEYFEIEPEVAQRLNDAKKKGKRIISVGTTTTRTLESSVCIKGHLTELVPQKNSTDIFIRPPYKFQFIDALITNFHLPESSLLMLVTAFAQSPNSSYQFSSFDQSIINQAYQLAIEHNYRFFSFGDAMFIL